MGIPTIPISFGQLESHEQFIPPGMMERPTQSRWMEEWLVVDVDGGAAEHLCCEGYEASHDLLCLIKSVDNYLFE